jgi:putative CocE/NonD family hydrolase
MTFIASYFRVVVVAVLVLSTRSGMAQDISVLVPMSDGVRLAADVYLPPGRETAARHPTLLVLTRYERSRQDAQGKPMDALVPLDKGFLAHGYALVKIDLRGSGASFGHRDAEYGPAETQDGNAIIDWVVAQPWCDGNVGAYGNSYTGTTAELLTACGNPALKAVAFSCSDFDIYRTACWPYGLYCKFIGAWSSYVRSLDLNKGKVGVRPVTADADGKLLLAAIAEHQANINVNTWILGSRFRDQPAPGFTVSLAKCSSLHWRKQIEASKVPMLVLASWLDGGTAIGALERLQYYSNPQKLLIMASTHGGKALASPFIVGGKSLPPVPAWDEQVQMRLDFFDQYLRGIDRGVENWPKVRYYHMGEEKMRATDQWPPAGTAMRTMYLGADHVLASAPAAIGSDNYDVDFEVTTGRTNRWFAQTSSPVLNLDHREKMDERMLLYTSPPLDADMDVTGTAVVHLWLSTDREDGAFLVYLEDVDVDGRSRYVTEGGLRGLHRKLGVNPDHPQTTPFHSFAKDDAAPMKPGEMYELAFELMPTSVTFACGHRLRLALAGADSDSFERVPAKGPARWHVARDPDHLSRIELPVVPDKPAADPKQAIKESR